jgi:ABC-2 type transport system ATP-binding protein
MSALFLDRVTKKYGGVVAVNGLSLSVEKSEMFGLIGPDGAGKTTLIRLLCGLLRSDEGEIRVLGHDPVRQHRQVTQAVGYLSQRFSLYGDLTVDENIAFFAEIHGVHDYADRRHRLLELTQLTPFRRRLADQLSGGMKQKLALACTLVHEPQVILLDEPTTGVDPVSRREFWKLLSEFLAQGITILMATPYLDEAERCSRVALLHEGRLLAVDRPEALRSSLPGEVVEVVADDRDRMMRALERLPGVGDVQLLGERAHVRFDPGAPHADPTRLSAILREVGVEPESVRRIPTSLEDVFIARVQERSDARGRWRKSPRAIE